MGEALDTKLEEEKGFTYDEVSGDSKEAGVLYQWIRAVHGVCHIEDDVFDAKRKIHGMKLLTAWGLNDFALKIIVFEADASKWNEIQRVDLRDKLGINDDEIKKWKEGLEDYNLKMKRTELLKKWDLMEIEDRFEDPEFADPVLWPMISKEIYKQRWKLKTAKEEMEEYDE